MTLLQGLLLGLLQGLTEFLPVSSSGHLVIAQNLFNLTESPVVFNILLHSATASAIVIVMWSSLKNLKLDLLKLLFLASLPAGVIGLLLNDKIENIFNSLPLVGLSLLLTATLLFISSKFLNQSQSAKLNPKNSLVIGFFQSLAIIPGISRSGSTIVAGLSQKLSPIQAFNFSFLLSLPAIAGAQLLHLKNLKAISSEQLPVFIVGFVSAFISGYFALKFLKQLVINGKLHYFGFYCLVLGLSILFFF